MMMSWKPIVSVLWLTGIFWLVVLGFGNLLFQNWAVGLTFLGILLFWLVTGVFLFVITGFAAGEEDFYRRPWSDEELETFGK